MRHFLRHRLKNMEVTIYNLPTSLTDALQDVVERISRTNEVPQHTANILHSFRQFQYLWDMFNEETQKALLHMILQSSDRFNPQVSGKVYEFPPVLRVLLKT